MIALPLLTLLLAADPAVEFRRTALAELRTSEQPQLALADPSRAEAAIEVCRERLARAGDGLPEPRAAQLAEALVTAARKGALPPRLASRALHAVAETRGHLGQPMADALAAIALEGPAGLRADATEVLGEVGDGRHVAVLARLAEEPALAEAAATALGRIGGKGVAAAFAQGIADAGAPTDARLALLRAAAKRELREAAPAAIQALGEPALAAEARKATLRLARKSDLALLRKAREDSKDAATRGALGRLIERLEKA